MLATDTSVTSVWLTEGSSSHAIPVTSVMYVDSFQSEFPSLACKL